jgi:hypothetical protein
MTKTKVTTKEAYSILRLTPRPLRADGIQDAVSWPSWQMFRRLLKGLSTLEKLEELRKWYWNGPTDTTKTSPEMALIRYTQVVNYVNALKRGGFIV